MLKRTILPLSALLLFLIPASAQNQKLTLKEAISEQNRKFRPQGLDALKPIPGGNEFSYLEKGRELRRISPQTGASEAIINLEALNTRLAASNIKPFNSIPADYVFEKPGILRFSGDKIIRVNLNDPSSNPDVSADFGLTPEYSAFSEKGSWTAFTKENNLFYVRGNSRPKSITNDKEPDIVNGSGYVHREEFGIHEGIFPSPEGNAVAFYRKDETMVTEYPLVNTAERIAGVKSIRYPMAGMTSEQVKLGVYTIGTGKTVFIQTGEPKDQYLTSVAWDPTEKYLLIGILNREQNHLKFNRYSATTGEWEKTLFEEKHPKWVEPENPPLFLKSKPNLFIWQSEQDGFNHLYLYDIDGKLIRQLSSGSEPVTRILGTDPTEENMFFETAADLGLSRKVHLVNLKTGKSRLLTPEKGTHNAVLSSDGNFLMIQYSSLTTPRRIYSLEVKTGKTKTILQAADPLKDYAMPKAEFINITAADEKTQLNGRIIRPADFDPDKKYPVIVYVYGGPHAQLVTDTWLGGAGLWDYYMAQEGFILFTLDNRGSADRGFDFENVIHRQLGQEEIKDQMRGVEYLKNLSYVDETRIGVYGWSFGGFMTTTLTTTHPDVFKAAVAGGPVIDWKWYEVMYGERYMDTPQENPEGYALSSLTDKAKNLKARLLMIHGAQDPVVVMQHSLEFVNACIKAGKQVDYFVYPDHEHNVRGKDREHLMEKIADYFFLHLK
jgi:dipeptidyl-peptidase-4